MPVLAVGSRFHLESYQEIRRFFQKLRTLPLGIARYYDKRAWFVERAVEYFDCAHRRFAPLARAVEDGSIGIAFEDAGLMRVGVELQAFAREANGIEGVEEALVVSHRYRYSDAHR